MRGPFASLRMTACRTVKLHLFAPRPAGEQYRQTRIRFRAANASFDVTGVVVAQQFWLIHEKHKFRRIKRVSWLAAGLRHVK